MSKSKLKISIFFPCYNDEKSIGKLVENAFLIVKQLTDIYEVIVIDDGSTDKSKSVLAELVNKHDKLKLIFHKKNKGYGGALKSGLKNARHEWIFYTDGDGQYDVKELPVLVSLISENVDFINGIKLARNDPTYRVFIGNLYSFTVRWLFWLPIFDVDCDFRLIRKKIIDKITLKNNSGSICVELVKKAERVGARFKQVSVHHYERRFGQSQFFRIDRILSTLAELLIMWINLMIIEKFFYSKKLSK